MYMCAKVFGTYLLVVIILAADDEAVTKEH